MSTDEFGGDGAVIANPQRQHSHKTTSSIMSLTLTYFPFPGRAYVTRTCLRMAGVEFVDTKLAGPEFQAAKGENKFPLGQMPIITLANGNVVTQSGAHARWAAKLAGTVEDPIHFSLIRIFLMICMILLSLPCLLVIYILISIS